ncbi:AraC family transcriptional regulator [Rubeoparvulum massiliense]|uniref:AraC family transcriptional regulator n=1 Tax=Rubeoparvulum massiliense TaxID=1631346 RepID=UPI00065E4CEC|nr:helix-turn-helix domain-containing protein [Rubeoparvulum massiliense]
MNYIKVIQNSLNYIEDNLLNAITLKDIAKHVHVSPWHFHRIFGLLVGETTAMYIRKRRFSQAAMRLLDSDHRIIDIAVSLGFSSHEAFTRSFKRLIGVTPDQYRLDEKATFQYPKLSFTENELFSMNSHFPVPEVQILRLDRMAVCGLSLRNLRVESSPSMEHNQRRIQALWNELCHLVERQREQVGVILPIGGTRYDYLAGLRMTEDLPLKLSESGKKLDTLEIPRQTYVVCSHQGSMIEVPLLYQYLFGHWFSKVEYEPVFAPELELYHHDGDGKWRVEIHLPIK